MARVRHMFPGGNTCHGFYSFYDYIVPPPAGRKIVLKGGPGTGKSTLLKNMARDFIEAGYDLELHWCSSDDQSLDGIVLASHQIAIIDGTAPHIVEPNYPGVMDEIINLGEFWDRGRLALSKANITTTIDLNRRYFSLAYSRLREARVVFDEWTSFYDQAIDQRKKQWLLRSLMERIFSHFPVSSPVSGNYPRHLFASAITPAGVITHLSSLVDRGFALHQVKGNPGTGVESLLESVSQLGISLGMAVENYHNPFVPEHLEAVILPDVPAAVVDTSGWVTNTEAALKDHPTETCTCLDELVDATLLHRFSGEIEAARNRFALGLGDAVKHISTAKSVHDQLEGYYKTAMDFEQVEARRQEMKEQILQCLK